MLQHQLVSSWSTKPWWKHMVLVLVRHWQCLNLYSCFPCILSLLSRIGLPDVLYSCCEGPKLATRGGWMGADQNLSQSEARLKITSVHPTLTSRVCKCSYSRARHQAKTLEISCEKIGSRAKNKHQNQHGILTPVKPTCEEILHRFNRRHRAGSREEALTG